MKKIFYLGYYDIPENKGESRNVCVSAISKMSYVVTALEKAGYGVNLISASQTHNQQKYKGKTVKIGENSNLILFNTLSWGNKIQRLFSVLYAKFQLAGYILKNISKDDTLMVYHSVAYADVVRVLKKFKNYKLILEVEEIYADVNNSPKDRKTEQKLFDESDAYIFPTELLNEKINTKNKPFCISYGSYTVEEDKKCKLNDGKIHIVYAGTFDARKGGALAALSAVPYLDSQYHMHIVGFGTEEDTKKVTDEIAILSKTCECKVTYDGLYTGEDYIRFLQSCHIGMSTQNPDGGFNDTSFPSKILSYLANGLQVVSVRIPVVENSKIGSLLYLYDENNGKSIAESICKVDINAPYNSRETIIKLDLDFTNKIKVMLENAK